ncbi:hypothetical protein HDU96_005328 [Phlyctochytrium bullatum]|nr:hypothetical protein HDU96_005328 [Phlyctochytrium bullatum]
MAGKKRKVTSTSDKSNKKKATETPSESAIRAKDDESTATDAKPESLAHPTNTKIPDNLVFPPLDPGMVKIATWNIVSVQSSMKKGLLDYILAEDADILCLCETKNEKPDGFLEKEYPFQFEHNYTS